MTTIKYLSIMTTLTVFTALFAILLQAFLASQDLKRLTSILSNLIILENLKANSITTIKPKIAIGYGSCSDLYVQATQFLNFSEIHLNDINREASVEVNDKDELLQNFAYYFQRGAAFERFTTNQSLFNGLIENAVNNKNLETRWSLGGNAPTMATRFQKEGATVLLAARMSNKLRTHIPDEILITSGSIDKDDIHLILEYKAGEQWGPYTAPRANRYILHNDQNNSNLSSVEKLEELLKNFNPRLLVVSGIQMMDNYPFPPGIRKQRLSKVMEQMTNQTTALIHFEMASYVEIKLLRLLLKYVIPFSESLGMNEQELENLLQVLDKGQVSFSADSKPRVAKTLTQMRKVFKLIYKNYFKNMKNKPYHRRLTRLHVHTLAYQAILVVEGSEWKNSKNAAAHAALTAHRHVCGTNIINPDASTLVLDDSFSTSTDTTENQRMKLLPSDPVSCWKERIEVGHDEYFWEQFKVEICVAPVLVCKVAKQTAGAGDNISAAGLILQI